MNTDPKPKWADLFGIDPTFPDDSDRAAVIDALTPDDVPAWAADRKLLAKSVKEGLDCLEALVSAQARIVATFDALPPPHPPHPPRDGCDCWNCHVRRALTGEGGIVTADPTIPNAGESTCPLCKRTWLVTPYDDCLVPECGCYGRITSHGDRPCHPCGLSHALNHRVAPRPDLPAAVRAPRDTPSGDPR